MSERMIKALQQNSYHCFAKSEARTIVKVLEKFVDDKETVFKSAYEHAAKVFETYAGDQIASKRFQRTAKAKRECDIRAEVWNDAAAELRKAVGGTK